MMKNNVTRAKELNEQLKTYDYEYFTNNNSIISDDEYDALWFELRHLLNDPEVKKALSKTDMSIGVQTSYLSKITHPKSVLSLDKEKIDDRDFMKKLKKFVDTYETDGKWTISEKLDGLTIVEYKQNDAATFATRGGSTVGENVTHQFVRNAALMQASDNVPNTMTIRGEGIIPRSSFDKIMIRDRKLIVDLYDSFVNDEHYHLLTISDEVQSFIDQYLDLNGSIAKELIAKKREIIDSLNASLKGYDAEFVRLGKSAIGKLVKVFSARERLYSNARNLSSASVRTNDTSTAVTNDVHYVVYDIMNSFNFGITTEEEVINTLKDYGFETVKHVVVTTEELLEFFKDDTMMNKWREESIYDIDGLVIKPNLKIENPKTNSHHEKGQLAVKFKPKGSYSILRDVEWSLTSNGRYSPIGIFDQVSIEGTLVSRASLNSWKSLKDLDLKIGDRIYVVRANDVIPQIASVDESYRDGSQVDIQLPANSELKGGIIYSTQDVELPLDKRIQKFMKRLGAQKLGVGIVKKLIENGYVDSIPDMFLLQSHVEQLKTIKGLGNSMVDQLISEVESVKQNMVFDRVVYALGIEGLGKKSIIDLVDFIPTMDSLKQLTQEQVDNAEEVYGISTSTVKGLKMLYVNEDLYDLDNMGLIL